jgi:hypothetical protein
MLLKQGNLSIFLDEDVFWKAYITIVWYLVDCLNNWFYFFASNFVLF